MTENVSLATFTLWTNSQDRLLTQHSTDIKEINEKFVELVGLVKDDINTTQKLIEIHIVEYKKDREQIDIRFTNLFKRQDKIDKILLQRQSMWLWFLALSWIARLIISSVIITFIGSLVKLAFFS